MQGWESKLLLISSMSLDNRKKGTIEPIDRKRKGKQLKAKRE